MHRFAVLGKGLIFVVGVMLVTPGCGNDDAANPTASTTAPTTTTPQATTTASTTTSATATTTSTATTTAVATTTTTEGIPVPLSNGDFETGDLTGWMVETFEDGAWLVYEDGSVPPDPVNSDPEHPFEVPDPPQGRYAAVTDAGLNGPGARFLYRDIEVEGSYVLHAIVFCVNTWGTYRDPDTWVFTDSVDRVVQNQQYRIELIDPAAPVDTLEPDDIWATVLRTKSGDPRSLEPTPLSFDLSPWEGQTIRLRLVSVNSFYGPLRAGIDDVRLEQRS